MGHSAGLTVNQPAELAAPDEPCARDPSRGAKVSCADPYPSACWDARAFARAPQTSVS